ncbi:MAG: hypothetical protein MZU79_00305, partial [Anaerotruncus sp.]|nr:hypothetical protein [Anaerotruncus sp.]
MAPLIVWTHRKNIGRLIRGEENRFEKLRVLPRAFREQRAEVIGNSEQDFQDWKGFTRLWRESINSLLLNYSFICIHPDNPKSAVDSFVVVCLTLAIRNP